MSAASFQNTSWSRFTIVQKLIVVNVFVFILIGVPNAILGLFHSTLDNYFNATGWLAVPSGFPNLLIRPWTLFTYMFLHKEILHILFNMLWLFWMGNIFLEFLGPKKLFAVYILGGLMGGLFYILAFNIFPLFSNIESLPLLGASASVFAITFGIATLLPDYSIRLLFIGNVPLKYLAFASFILDLLNISGPNAGGHFAHLGGALFGYIYIRQLKSGNDLAAGFIKLADRVATLFSSQRVVYRNPSRKSRIVSDEDFVQNKKGRQEQIDQILDKISKSGYGSLTQQEKELLFKSSKEDL